MSRNVNSIKNPDFRKGRTQPAAWSWSSTTPTIHWQRNQTDVKSTLGLLIQSDENRGAACFSQTVVVSPKQYYRVEALVTCNLNAHDERSGVFLRIEPAQLSKPARRKKEAESKRYPVRLTPPIVRASAPILIRTYFHAPPDVRRLQVSICIESARGEATIHEVRVIEIIEPDEESHILATPLPVNSTPAPRIARSVAVCSESADERPLTKILKSCLGDRNVRGMNPSDLKKGIKGIDAIFLPDAQPPPTVRSMRGLLELAEDRTVVISLPAFAKIAGSAVRLRRIDQPDDPTFARVTFANHATRGFALHDIFAFGDKGRGPYGFAQNQMRKSKTLTAFCERHGLVELLSSMCNKDATSNHPVSLFRETPGGGLFVLDIEPVEQPASTFNEPNLALQIVLNILGWSSTGLGQYVVPIARGEKMRDFVREMNARMNAWVVHDDEVPSNEVTQQLVTLGRDDEVFGLPIRPKPMILIRSGLQPGDVESVYSAFIWFKNLIRQPPHECPYAQALGSMFRLAWMPFSSAWESRDGWEKSSNSPADFPALAIDTEDGLVEALIDVVPAGGSHARVVVPSPRGENVRLFQWLPEMTRAFRVGEHFGYIPSNRARNADRDDLTWRWMTPTVEVVADAVAFAHPTYRNLKPAVRNMVRIEIPGHDADFIALSTHRTNLAATLLEQIVGLMYGLIAVNRSSSPVQLNGFAPVHPGQALIIQKDDPILNAFSAEAV